MQMQFFFIICEGTKCLSAWQIVICPASWVIQVNFRSGTGAGPAGGESFHQSNRFHQIVALVSLIFKIPQLPHGVSHSISSRVRVDFLHEDETPVSKITNLTTKHKIQELAIASPNNSFMITLPIH